MAKTVLIVDDDPVIRETFAEIVALTGNRAELAENGAVALDLLRGGLAPELILLDLMMPVKDGFEFREEQVRDPRFAAIPVIVLSAMGNLAEAVRRLGEGIAWLRKPPDLEELIRLIQSRL